MMIRLLYYSATSTFSRTVRVVYYNRVISFFEIHNTQRQHETINDDDDDDDVLTVLSTRSSTIIYLWRSRHYITIPFGQQCLISTTGAHTIQSFGLATTCTHNVSFIASTFGGYSLCLVVVKSVLWSEAPCRLKCIIYREREAGTPCVVF
jgi:hypothetical protein